MTQSKWGLLQQKLGVRKEGRKGRRRRKRKKRKIDKWGLLLAFNAQQPAAQNILQMGVPYNSDLSLPRYP